MAHLTVRDIAIARSGDKGNRATLSVIARDAAHYALLERAPTIEVCAGARSCDVDLRLDSTIVPVATGTRDWIDPLIGARATLPLSNNSYVITSGDVGGFSLGSDFCWSLEALVGIDLFVPRQRTALQFGYRALGIDYDAGAVGDEFVLDAVQHGPVLVFAIAF